MTAKRGPYFVVGYDCHGVTRYRLVYSVTPEHQPQNCEHFSAKSRALGRVRELNAEVGRTMFGGRA